MTIANDPRLTPIDPVPPNAAGLVGAVATAYEDAGYHAGYSAAVRDYISLLFGTPSECAKRTTWRTSTFDPSR